MGLWPSVWARDSNPGQISQSRDFGIDIFLIPGFRDPGIQDLSNPRIPGLYYNLEIDIKLENLENEDIINLIIDKHKYDKQI